MKNYNYLFNILKTFNKYSFQRLSETFSILKIIQKKHIDNMIATVAIFR